MAFKSQIKARFTDAVLFECELDSKYESEPESVVLGAAVKKAVNTGANLARAYLAGANLDGANLDGANLARANLAGAKIGDYTIIKIITRVWRTIDTYEFIALATDKGILIRAGCKTKTPTEYRVHVAEKYPGTDKAEETLAIIDFIEARAAKVTP